MTDTYNPFSSIFWQNDPNVNKELRQRIALSMMHNKRAAPKNLGEGLSAIGDAIGDRGLASMLEKQELAADAAGRAARQSVMADPAAAAPAAAAAAPETRSYAPPSSISMPPQAPSMLTTTPPAQQPSSSLFQPDHRAAGANTPQQPPSMLSPQPLTGAPQAAPAAPAGEIRTGEYNEMDAQADMPRKTPGYMVDAIARRVANPDMRAYYGTLTGGEAKNANDVSKTGAAGPFQFVPGTADQYGLTNPKDLDASTDAAVRFTQDNAKVFERINGRPPTMAELAVMHQQGGVTGAKMIAGTGNASGRNLGLNNIDPSAGPAQAVAGIKKYYGMPERVVDTRDNIARVMAQGGDEAPPQQMALTQTSPANAMPPMPGIQKAPPAAPPIQQAPPMQQVAQPQGAYVTPQPKALTPPPQVPMEPLEARALKAIQDAPAGVRENVAAQLAPVIQEAQRVRAHKQKQADEIFKDQQTQNRALELKREDMLKDKDERDQKAALAPAQLRKTNAEAADLEAKAAAGRVPVTKTINGVDFQWEQGKGWIKPPGTGDAEPDLPEYQGKEVKSYQRGRRALYNMGAGDALHSWTDWYGSGVPVVGNLLTSARFQTQYNAADEFTNLVLRGETGQGSTPAEIANTVRRFVPKPGSSPELIEQMRVMREGILSAIRDGSGKGRTAIDRFDKKFAEEIKTVTEARQAAMEKGKPSGERDVVKDLPPVVISTKQEKDALPRGRFYRLPTDPPDMRREKKEHD